MGPGLGLSCESTYRLGFALVQTQALGFSPLGLKPRCGLGSGDAYCQLGSVVKFKVFGGVAWASSGLRSG